MAAEAAIEEIHRSVLLDEVLQYLDPVPGGLYVDGTLGLGGHTAAILSRCAPDGRVIAFEWDEAAIALSRKRLADFGSRLTIIRSNFAEIVIGLNGVMSVRQAGSQNLNQIGQIFKIQGCQMLGLVGLIVCTMLPILIF